MGSRFPTIMMHSDCEGAWSPEECIALKRELVAIRDEMARLPVVPWPSASRCRPIKVGLGLRQQSDLDCFINVDAETLDAIERSAELAMRLGRPTTFA